jgi:hypothetical protein
MKPIVTRAVYARAVRSIFGHGFARAGRDTTALLTRIYDTWEQVSPVPEPFFCSRQGNKLAAQVYQDMLLNIRGLNGSFEAECVGVHTHTHGF